MIQIKSRSRLDAGLMEDERDDSEVDLSLGGRLLVELLSSLSLDMAAVRTQSEIAECV
jgi:hypothetical protein